MVAYTLGSLFAAAACALPAAGAEPQHRWVYVSQNLLVDKNVQTTIDLMRRSKAAGYTAIVLADYKLNLLDRMDARYFANVDQVKAEAKRLGLAIIPCIFPIGYSNGLLAHDPNLAVGLPVRGAPFIVSGRSAEPKLDETRLVNGDFEEFRGDTMLGWAFQDQPGRITFADRAVAKHGRMSLRVQDIGTHDPQHGHGRISQRLKVARFRAYHLSVWLKTKDFERPGDVRVAVLSKEFGTHTYRQWPIKPTQDWTQHHLVFNSLTAGEVTLYLGVWGGKGGTLWWDDCRLEAGDLSNVLRRAECPLVVTSDDGLTTYREGEDFEPLADPKLGRVPYAGEYDDWHIPPKLTLTSTSRIRDGQALQVSYFHPTIIYGSQVCCSLTDPKVFEIMTDQMQRVHRLFDAPGYFMSYDEIRVGNWEAAEGSPPASGPSTMGSDSDDETSKGRAPFSPTRPQRTAGEVLAAHVRRAVEIARTVAPKATLYIWSDMFDPNHNAVDKYYLVNGSLKGAWEGLPKDVVIVPWYFAKRAESLRWFADRGHRQVIAGYYDGRPERIREWLAAAAQVPGVDGVMYTTWQQKYADLEAFMNAVRESAAPGR
jgi:hypothetical protein